MIVRQIDGWPLISIEVKGQDSLRDAMVEAELEARAVDAIRRIYGTMVPPVADKKCEGCGQ